MGIATRNGVYYEKKYLIFEKEKLFLKNRLSKTMGITTKKRVLLQKNIYF